MAKKRTRRRIRPDEAFRFGPFEVARFGKYVQYRNRSTREQHEEQLRRLAERFDELASQIEACVTRIATNVSRCDPVALLKRAWWTNAHLLSKIESEADIGREEVHALRMIDYVQSVAVSYLGDGSERSEPTDEHWESISDDVRRLFMLLSLSYPLARLAKKRQAGEPINQALEDYYFKALNYWCQLRGRRYAAHNAAYFRTLLEPHDAVLRAVFGAGTEGVLSLVASIERRSTIGIQEAVDNVTTFQVKVFDEVVRQRGGEVDEATFMAAAGELIERRGWRTEFEGLLDRLYGDGLFEIRAEFGVSQQLLDNLALGLGDDSAFFADGAFKGWPLRVWPIWRKPFLRVDGKILCFDYYSVMDHLYRTLQSQVLTHRPEYKEEWNRKQKEVSETWPLDLLRRLLPGAVVVRNVYYPHPRVAGEWCEADAVVTFDDAMFVVEVKAGAFCREPPATDFEAYVRSLKNLIENPSSQATRFVEYFESADEVALFDAAHREAARVRRSDVGLLVPMTVSLDNLSELAAQAKHLVALGIEVGPRPVWSVAIEDLMVCADVFTNPLVFLHYIERRLAAHDSPLLQVEDELDHVGLYLQHNDYVAHAEELSGQDTRVQWSGYRVALDKFFHSKVIGDEDANPPEQGMPDLLRDVLATLARQGRPGRRRLSNYLLSYGSDGRNGIWAKAEEALQAQRNSGHPRPLTAYGDHSVTVFFWEKGGVRLDVSLTRRHALVAVAAAKKSETWLLEVTRGDGGRVEDVSGQFLRVGDLGPAERAGVLEDAGALADKRVRDARGAGRAPGPNEQCLCGSGRKFKKCHG